MTRVVNGSVLEKMIEKQGIKLMDRCRVWDEKWGHALTIGKGKAVVYQISDDMYEKIRLYQSESVHL